jgi:hypothetical protein
MNYKVSKETIKFLINDFDVNILYIVIIKT